MVTSEFVSRRRVSRPALAERMREALGDGSLLVVADAGFGKTLGLEEALADRRQVAWVSCTEADRDAGLLLVSILGGLRRAVPGAVDVLAERLTAGAGSVDPLLAGRELTAELERLLVEPVVVVLDDAERLDGAGTAATLIGDLLAARARLRLAIASRRELPLKTARLQASGGLTLMRSDDLAFSVEECTRFLAMRFDREPLTEEVVAAMESTEGWPLGLELATAGGPPFADAGRAAFRYLAEEVLAGLDAALRRQALESSVVRELSPPVIESLGLGGNFVAKAQASGLFLRPVDAGPNAYAYHPLFREFLLDALVRERSEAELRELHARAARGVSASGRDADSVEHWLASRHWTAAIEAMARASPQLRRASPATLRAWMDRLARPARGAPTGDDLLHRHGTCRRGAG